MSKHLMSDLAGDLYVLHGDLGAMTEVIRSMIELEEDRNRLETDGDRLAIILSLLEFRRAEVKAWAIRADDGAIKPVGPPAEKPASGLPEG